MYTLNYNTGAGNETFETIEEAMAAVDPCYTQMSITIDDSETGRELYKMPWWGCRHTEDDEDVAFDFGDYGYYSSWQESNEAFEPISSYEV